MMDSDDVDFRHLLNLTGSFGTFEHADGTVARVELGHRTDDVALALVVATRESRSSKELTWLSRKSMDFLIAAQDESGLVKSRRSSFGTWFGPPNAGDSWGRSQWAFGTAAARQDDPATKSRMLNAFARGARVNSPLPRANAFAALGAGEILRQDSANAAAFEILQRTKTVLESARRSSTWNWPEPRLEYANGLLPHALMTVGICLGEDRLVSSGLSQLEWLTEHEVRNGHLSPTGEGGAGPGDKQRQFEQRPLEVASLAGAAACALEYTDDKEWLRVIAQAALWFDGFNDVGVPMRDVDSGGSYDFLAEQGPDGNQGAEATLSLIATLQHSRVLTSVRS
jgi:hypothetical protein